MNKTQASKLSIEIYQYQEEHHKLRDKKKEAEEKILRLALSHKYDALPDIVAWHEALTEELHFSHVGINNRYALLREGGYTVSDKYDFVDAYLSERVSA
jgi:hypothetical protein